MPDAAAATSAQEALWHLESAFRAAQALDAGTRSPARRQYLSDLKRHIREARQALIAIELATGQHEMELTTSQAPSPTPQKQ